MSSTPEKFESWAVVEVMGHNRYAGLVTEQAIGGCAFVRVDVAEVGERPAFTKLLSQAAIFCITPCSEAVARAAAAQSYSRPVEVYAPALPPPSSSYSRDQFEPDEDC